MHGITSKQAAEILGLTTHRTLDVWRTQGRGPDYFKIGSAVRYDRDEVIAWREARRCKSTSAYPVELPPQPQMLKPEQRVRTSRKAG